MSRTIWWPNFCGNESIYDAFWSDALTINTANPDFTNCFQNTVLIWIPSLVFLLSSCIYIPYVLVNIPDTPGRGFSKLGFLQLIALILLILVGFCEFIFLMVTINNSSVQADDITGNCLTIATYILALLLHIISARRGFYNTGVAFLFWFLSILVAAVTLRSKILQFQEMGLFLFSTCVIRFTLVLVQFICTFIPDTRPVKYGSLRERSSLLHKPHQYAEKSEEQQLLNPTLTCSFPSYIIFFWFMPLLKQGYVGDITMEHIWKTKERYTAKVEIHRFDRQWQKAMNKKEASDQEKMEKCYESSEEILTSGESQNISENKQKLAVRADGWLLFRALFRAFGGQYLPAAILIFIYFAGILLNPFLLQAVIDFVESDSTYAWKGYVYALAMFALGIFSPIVFHNHLQITFTVAMRTRTALTSAVYRKALKLSAIAKRRTTVGEIVNLMSVDVQKVQDCLGFLIYVWPVPLLVGCALYFLWQLLGPSCLTGLIYLFGILPAASWYITRVMIKLQVENMALKDERIKLINQVLTGIRVLKLYAWEPYFEKRVSEIRKKETDNLRMFWLVIAFANALLICTPFIVAVLCFTTYVLSDPENVLTAQVAFVSLSYLNIMSLPINVIPFVIMQCAQGFVSLKRISKFLQEDEINPNSVTRSNLMDLKDDIIKLKDATFSWGGHRKAMLRHIDVEMKRGHLTAVVGEVGSGKSSLLAAILGDMIKQDGTVNVAGSIAYVPQQAWIQNLTLKDNILFGKELDNDKYKSILELCALEHDLSVLPGGDRTEIGERGINLSGGQKQRVSLARAVYHDTDIYLLDDPLSAVDSHVGKHIFDKVIGPQGCLQHKTRVFVTNQLQYLQYTDEVIVMEDGQISERGAFEELLQHDRAFARFIRTHLEDEAQEGDEEVRKEIKMLERALSHISAHSDDVQGHDVTTTGEKQDDVSFAMVQKQAKLAKRQKSRKSTYKSESQSVLSEKLKRKHKEALLTEETMERGTIKLSVLKWYIAAASYAQLFIAMLGLLGFIASQAGTNIWLSAWSNDANINVNDTATSLYLRLGVYCGLGVAQVVGTGIFTVALALSTVRAARVIHSKLLSNVLKCPMSFFDTTALGRILNRFSKDVDHLDKNVPEFMQDALLFGAPLIATFVVIIYSIPIFIAAFVPIVIIFFILQRTYANCARQIKRLDSVKRSPIYNFFSETLNGVSSIRAYGCEQRFITNSDRLLDQSQSVWFTVFSSNRWVNLAGECIGGFVVLFVVMFVVMQRDSLTAGLAGLAVTYSLQVSIDLTLILRSTSELETYIVAVERINEYALEQTEAAWKLDGRSPDNTWPDKGVVQFKNYSTRYRPGLDTVLNNLTFKINACEKVGVVGRTGAGKSSLAMALFRLLEASAGAIVIDDLDIATYGLHDVRSKLSIIPQDPVLFSGSLRFNLDPSSSHSDGELWDALQHAHLQPFVSSLSSQLEYECGEDGQNLSVGQRQLVCLARALLRKSKVLVLDEATASVDMETDSLIQVTIKQEFKHCTIITVAHRLNTILDYDRILVLENGRVLEFDSPDSLLQDKSSHFYSMAKAAGVVH